TSGTSVIAMTQGSSKPDTGVNLSPPSPSVGYTRDPRAAVRLQLTHAMYPTHGCGAAWWPRPGWVGHAGRRSAGAVTREIAHDRRHRHPRWLPRRRDRRPGPDSRHRPD